MQKAILLLGHGSSLPNANETMRQIIGEIQGHYPGYQTGCVFLETEKPSITDGIEAAVEKGARYVMLIPYFLQAGKHVVTDIPTIVKQEQEKHPDVKIVVAPHLGFDEALVKVVLERIRQVDDLGIISNYE